MKSRTKKLAESIIFNIIGVILISVVLGTGILLMFSSQRLNSLNTSKSIVITNAIDFQVENFVIDQIRIMEEFELIYTFHNDSPELIRDFYVKLLDLHPEYSRFLILDNQGTVISSYPGDQIVDGTDHSYYNYFLQAEKGDFYWSDTFYDVVENSPRVALSVKVEDVVLVAYLDLIEINSFIDKLDIGEDSSVAVVDGSGTYIAHSNINKVAQREKDSDLIDALNNKIDLTKLKTISKENGFKYFKNIASTQWYVAINQSTKPVEDLMRENIFVSSVFITVLLLFFIVVSFRKMKNIKMTFRKFTDNIIDVATGNYDKKIENEEYYEFKELGDQFNIMAQSIHSREKTIQDLNKDLELKVEERTRMLDDSNQELRQTIDNLEETQEKLINSEKMASIGQVVAGVAHEINTPLGISITTASYIDMQTKKIHEDVDENNLSKKSLLQYLNEVNTSTGIMLNTLDRASELIQSFKQVAVVQSTSNKVMFDPCDIVKSVVTSLKTSADKIEVKLIFTCSLDHKVNSWPGRLSQITLNLIQNALIHGFKDKENGSILVDLSTYKYGIRLEIKDDGSGIPDDVIKKIYEPFFTTGRLEGSTGLGLNIVYNMVESVFEGRIECLSKVGEGTSFIVYLPIELSLKE